MPAESRPETLRDRQLPPEVELLLAELVTDGFAVCLLRAEIRPERFGRFLRMAKLH